MYCVAERIQQIMQMEDIDVLEERKCLGHRLQQVANSFVDTRLVRYNLRVLLVRCRLQLGSQSFWCTLYAAAVTFHANCKYG